MMSEKYTDITEYIYNHLIPELSNVDSEVIQGLIDHYSKPPFEHLKSYESHINEMRISNFENHDIAYKLYLACCFQSAIDQKIFDETIIKFLVDISLKMKQHCNDFDVTDIVKSIITKVDISINSCNEIKEILL